MVGQIYEVAEYVRLLDKFIYLRMKKKECPSCAMDIDTKSKLCPICGHEFSEHSPLVKWIAILLLLLFLLYFIF